MIELHRKSRLFIEPRCNSWVAIGVTAGSMAVSYGVQASGALSNTPSYPDTAASSAEMANAQAEQLAEMRRMQAQAQLGGLVVNPGYTQSTISADQYSQMQSQLASLNSQLNSMNQSEGGGRYDHEGNWTSDKGGRGNNRPDTGGRGNNRQERTALQQQIATLQSQLSGIPEGGGTVYKDKNGNIVPASKATTDFSGMSEADIQGTIMKELAQGQLDNAKQYDSQFIASALAQEEQSNPQGVEARKELYDQIQNQIATPPVSPVANEMERQASERVAAGSGLTAEEQQMLDASIKSRGGTAGGDFASPLTTGQAGEARAIANAGAGTKWLSSGETPADIAYRSQQQNLSNLSSYISGQTPQSQFKELSGAQSGPTPNYSGTTPLPSYNTGAATQGGNAAVTGYQQSVSSALNTPNPWMAGISGALGAANVAGSLGYRPLSSQ